MIHPKGKNYLFLFQQIEYDFIGFHDLEMGEHSFSTQPAADLYRMLVALCSLLKPLVPYFFNQ